MDSRSRKERRGDPKRRGRRRKVSGKEREEEGGKERQRQRDRDLPSLFSAPNSKAVEICMF